MPGSGIVGVVADRAVARQMTNKSLLAESLRDPTTVQTAAKVAAQIDRAADMVQRLKTLVRRGRCDTAPTSHHGSCRRPSMSGAVTLSGTTSLCTSSSQAASRGCRSTRSKSSKSCSISFAILSRRSIRQSRVPSRRKSFLPEGSPGLAYTVSDTRSRLPLPASPVACPHRFRRRRPMDLELNSRFAAPLPKCMEGI